MLNRKSLVSNNKKVKDALPKPPSSPGRGQSTPPPAPLSVSDVGGGGIGFQLSALYSSFDRKLEALQAFIMATFFCAVSRSY